MRSSSKRGSQKRDTVKAQNATLYAKRTLQGPVQGDGREGPSAVERSTPKGEDEDQIGYGDRGDRAS
jgi:hypothetical protein